MSVSYLLLHISLYFSQTNKSDTQSYIHLHGENLFFSCLTQIYIVYLPLSTLSRTIRIQKPINIADSLSPIGITANSLTQKGFYRKLCKVADWAQAALLNCSLLNNSDNRECSILLINQINKLIFSKRI